MLQKATGFARVITGKKVEVLEGNVSQGPFTNLKKIFMNQAMVWDEIDRFGILIHECAHIIFPASYPTGNLKQLANMIDDARIERQFLDQRPQYTDALASVAINAIANGIYENPNVDRFSEENFDPSIWALLFFRHHVGEEVQLAAAHAIKSYSERKGYTDQEWKNNFDKLVKDGQKITRLKKVKKQTLSDWCKLYFIVFPDAKKDINGLLPSEILNDTQSADPGEEEEGSGNLSDDEKIAQKAKSGSEGKSDSGDDLKGKLEELKKKVGDVGGKTKESAKSSVETEAIKEEKKEEQEDVYVPPGSEKADLVNQKDIGGVNKGFVIRVKQSMRKLRSLAIDRIETHRKTGRLHMPTVIAAEKIGVLPKRPFLHSTDELTEKPIACVVATDFSGSTDNVNASLNHFAHNALFALQDSGCECAEVVWNSSAWVTKRIEETVSPIHFKKHSSEGGTCLIAASKGCVDALKGAKAQRKIAFIFTDGCVDHSEVSMVHTHLKENGFEAVLLVSVGSAVPHHGIVDSQACKDISSLSGIFDRWVRKQMARTIQ